MRLRGWAATSSCWSCGARASTPRPRSTGWRIKWKATGSAVTFSAGVTTFDGDDRERSPLERADEALYAAKRAGRNRVERAAGTADVAELAQA